MNISPLFNIRLGAAKLQKRELAKQFFFSFYLFFRGYLFGHIQENGDSLGNRGLVLEQFQCKLVLALLDRLLGDIREGDALHVRQLFLDDLAKPILIDILLDFLDRPVLVDSRDEFCLVRKPEVVANAESHLVQVVAQQDIDKQGFLDLLDLVDGHRPAPRHSLQVDNDPQVPADLEKHVVVDLGGAQKSLPVGGRLEQLLLLVFVEFY